LGSEARDRQPLQPLMPPSIDSLWDVTIALSSEAR
jgi:hypothetical protein